MKTTISLLFSFLVTNAALVNGFQSAYLQNTAGKKSFALHSEPNHVSTEHLFSLDPHSALAHDLITEDLGLSLETYKQLAELSHVITELNEGVNLVSRKDCNPSTVFGRHILPCVVACALKDNNPLDTAKNAVDVGTGGGFPGLVLAVLYPSTEFVLLDSVGKKLAAVQEAAGRIGLKNVKIHHGRSEEYEERFDVATGRSVTALPQFCAWMQHLLNKSGSLLYWIGGEIPENVLEQAERDVPVSSLVPVLESSDKRIIVFPAEGVTKIAKESGLLRLTKSTKPSSANKKKRTDNKKKKATAKGAWSKDRDSPKQRGYEGFKRYSFTPDTTSSGEEDS